MSLIVAVMKQIAYVPSGAKIAQCLYIFVRLVFIVSRHGWSLLCHGTAEKGGGMTSGCAKSHLPDPSSRIPLVWIPPVGSL